MSRVKKTQVHNGKKGVRWWNDPQILLRLAQVSGMMVRGAKSWQIAEATNCSLATAKRDMSRVRELWKEEARGEVEDNRAQSIAQIRHVQEQAWDKYDAIRKDQSKAIQALKWLQLVRECERDIADLQGTRAPAQTQLTTPEDKPLPVKITEVVINIPAEVKMGGDQ